MRKKKLSQLTILRWLNLYRGRYPIADTIKYEMGRMESHKDVLRCAAATSMECNRGGGRRWPGKVALIVNPKAVRRVFNSDVWSEADGHKGSLTANGWGSCEYSECWVKATRDCYVGIAVLNWSCCKAEYRRMLAEVILQYTPWDELLDIASGNVIDLNKWFGV